MWRLFSADQSSFSTASQSFLCVERVCKPSKLTNSLQTHINMLKVHKFSEDALFLNNLTMKSKIQEPYFYIYRITVGLLTLQKTDKQTFGVLPTYI